METEPIKLIRKLNDRHKRRQSQFEAEKLLDDLLRPVDLFYENLFDDNFISNDSISYADLYNSYIAQFGKIVEWNYRVRKPKYFRINENYFSELFKPIENETKCIK